jgi:hypothetical protein
MMPLQGNAQNLPVGTQEITIIWLVASFLADIQPWRYQNTNKMFTGMQ